MQIKIRGRKLAFDPQTIQWRHQSSPQTRFGVWSSSQGAVFVKRFSSRPTGWALLEKLKKKKLNNTPQVLALLTEEEKPNFYAFFEMLEGDILSEVLKRGRVVEFFGQEGLSEEERTRLIISVYGTLLNLHEQGFWYPDLDFKNVFITPTRPGFHVSLIDVDSCVAFGQPTPVDQVSQRYWEGLAATFQEAGKPFLKKGLDGFSRDLVADGRCLNQSMLLLFAYAVKRLGKVPSEAPLFPQLVASENPVSQEVRRLHAGWLNGRNQEKELGLWMADYLKLSPDELRERTLRLTPPSPSGIGSLLSRLFGN